MKLKRPISLVLLCFAFVPSLALGQEPGTVKVQVYDQLGVRIRTLAERRHDAGPWTTFWDGLAEDGRRVASGIYLVVAETTTSRVAAKVTLVR